MIRSTSRVLVGACALAVAACGESTTSPRSASDLIANALTTVSPGFPSLSSSFSASAPAAVWVPGPGGPGRNGLGMGALMGGGIGPDFDGEVAFGAGPGGFDHHHGPFASPSCAGTYNATTGVVSCTATQNGLTINRTIAYKTAAGAAQAAADSTTNTVVEHVDVSGTTTFTRDTTQHGFGREHGPGGFGFFGLGRGSDSSHVEVLTATTTVKHASDRTTTGLAKGSTQRTVNGAAAASESSTGTTTQGTFTATRVTGDTTKGLVIPVSSTGPTYPTAGTVIRVMSATVTLQGQAAQSTSRREVLTYDGSATAKLTITQDGTTKTCTLPLPRGRPSCS